MKSYSISLFLILISLSSFAQGGRKSFQILGSVSQGDTVQINVSDYYGDLRWQKSDDLQQWQFLAGEGAGKISFIAESSCYIRAEVRAGTCDAVYSDTLLVQVFPRNLKVFKSDQHPGLFTVIPGEQNQILVHDLDLVDSLMPGDIILSDEGNGFLRRIKTIEKEGDAAILSTSIESFSEIFDLVDLFLKGTFSNENVDTLQSRAGLKFQMSQGEREGDSLEISISGQLFDEDGDTLTFPDQIVYSGTYTLGGSWHLAWDRNKEINSFQYFSENLQTLDFHLSVGNLQKLWKPEPISAARLVFKPVKTNLKGIPVVASAEMDFMLDCEVGPGLMVNSIASQSLSFQGGIAFNQNSYTISKEFVSPVDGEMPELVGTGNLKIKLVPVLRILLYGENLVITTSNFGTSFHSELYKDPAWTQHCQVEMSLNTKMDPFSSVIPDFQKQQFYFTEVELFHAPGRPHAVFEVIPDSGDVFQLFHFDASSSWDAQDDTSLLQVRWDWEGDGSWDVPFSTTKVTDHLYSQTGMLHPRMEVMNTSLGKDTASLTLTITKPALGAVSDREGNVYKIVTIGTQTWMAENLRVTQFNDGTPIELVSGSEEWSTVPNNAYCWHNNDEKNKLAYGALYNWYVISSGKNVCPTGWHVPTDAEWSVLEEYLIAKGFNFDGSVHGNKIGKAMATANGWSLSNKTGAVGNNDFPMKRNASGWAGVPGGNRNAEGKFFPEGYRGFWWTSTPYTTYGAWGRSLNSGVANLARDTYDEQDGMSIRCLRD